MKYEDKILFTENPRNNSGTRQSENYVYNARKIVYEFAFKRSREIVNSVHSSFFCSVWQYSAAHDNLLNIR